MDDPHLATENIIENDMKFISHRKHHFYSHFVWPVLDDTIHYTGKGNTRRPVVYLIDNGGARRATWSFFILGTQTPSSPEWRHTESPILVAPSTIISTALGDTSSFSPLTITVTHWSWGILNFYHMRCHSKPKVFILPGKLSDGNVFLIFFY